MASGLPAGWVRQFSQSKQLPYYYNPVTKQSVWKLEDLRDLPAPKPTTVALLPVDFTAQEVVQSELGDIESNNFRNMVRARLKAFNEGKDTAYEFEPCAKDLREIIHEEALDRCLISASKGDDNERFVAVYKKGFEPVEPIVHSDLLATAAPVTGKRKAKRIEAPPPPIAEELEVLGVVKRDRRTIEEVEADIRRAKGKKP